MTDTVPAVRLIVTRPLAQGEDWVRALRALGQDAQALPLIAIAPPADPAPVHAAWRRLAGMDLVMFVSANAVAHFFALAPPRAVWPAGVMAASTGPGTSAALRAAGVPEAQCIAPPTDAGQFDSEALWARLRARDWGGCQALIVRGEDGRNWLSDRLREDGAEVDFVIAYARCAPQPDAAQQALLDHALADPAAHVWLFSSSEAVGHLRALAPAADWQHSRAIASHPRIAQAARTLGFSAVGLFTPTPQALVDHVQRMLHTPSIESAPL